MDTLTITFLKIPEVQKQADLSRFTIYQPIKHGKFP